MGTWPELQTGSFWFSGWKELQRTEPAELVEILKHICFEICFFLPTFEVIYERRSLLGKIRKLLVLRMHRPFYTRNLPRRAHRWRAPRWRPNPPLSPWTKLMVKKMRKVMRRKRRG